MGSAARGPLISEGNHTFPPFHASVAATHTHTHRHTLFPTSASKHGLKAQKTKKTSCDTSG